MGCADWSPTPAIRRNVAPWRFSQLAVVQQHVGDIHPVFDGSGQFHRVLSETSVSRDRDHLAPFQPVKIPGGCPCSHTCRKSKADGAKITGHEHSLPFCLEITAKGVGVVAHVHRDDRVARRDTGKGVKYRSGMDAFATFFAQTGLLFIPPHLPPLGQFAYLIRSIRGAADLWSDAFTKRADLCPDRQGDGVELAQLHPLIIDLNDGLASLDPGMIGKRMCQELGSDPPHS